jgi:hypothetical protein
VIIAKDAVKVKRAPEIPPIRKIMLDNQAFFCYYPLIIKATTEKKEHAQPLQRAAGWCEAARRVFPRSLPSRRTKGVKPSKAGRVRPLKRSRLIRPERAA